MAKRSKKMAFNAALLMGFLMGMAACAHSPDATNEKNTIARIGQEEARMLVSGGQALLVCAYDDKSCASRMLEGAVMKSELDARLSELPKDQQIIFYCG